MQSSAIAVSVAPYGRLSDGASSSQSTLDDMSFSFNTRSGSQSLRSKHSEIMSGMALDRNCTTIFEKDDSLARLLGSGGPVVCHQGLPLIKDPSLGSSSALPTGATGNPFHSQQSYTGDIDPVYGAPLEDVFDEDDYQRQLDSYSQYQEGGSEGEGYGCRDEDMLDPAPFGMIGETFRSSQASGATAESAGSWGIEYAGDGRPLPTCFAMEADCRAAWAALQPGLHQQDCFAAQQQPEYTSLGVGHNSLPKAHGTSNMAIAMGGGMGGASGFAERTPPREEPSAGPPEEAEEPYAPQSTERRRKPRRRWDPSVNYQRITRRLELHFDAVASEAPTTPPSRAQPQRSTMRTLAFDASSSHRPGPSPAARRETFPATGATPSGCAPQHAASDAAWAHDRPARGCTLMTAMSDMSGAVDEDAMRGVIIGCALSLQALHADGWLHRDVGLLSVELDARDAFHTARLRAGSLAVHGGQEGRFTEVQHTPVGQAAFQPPEVVACRRGCVTYNAAGDMWGLGIVLLMMLNGGRAPFGSGGPAAPPMTCDALQAQLDLHLVKHLQEASAELSRTTTSMADDANDADRSRPNSAGSEAGGGHRTQPCAMPLLAIQLMCALLRADPGQRLSAAAVLRHPWIVAAQSECMTQAASEAALLPRAKASGSETVMGSEASLRPWSTDGMSDGGRIQSPLTPGPADEAECSRRGGDNRRSAHGGDYRTVNDGVCTDHAHTSNTNGSGGFDPSSFSFHRAPGFGTGAAPGGGAGVRPGSALPPIMARSCGGRPFRGGGGGPFSGGGGAPTGRRPSSASAAPLYPSLQLQLSQGGAHPPAWHSADGPALLGQAQQLQQHGAPGSGYRAQHRYGAGMACGGGVPGVVYGAAVGDFLDQQQSPDVQVWLQTMMNDDTMVDGVAPGFIGV